jgi:aspartyl-tRNA(Asn)/glutamyl-tRNA(Gln) amidotransferase subunit A
VLLGTYVLSAGYQDAWYRTAQKARGLLRAELERAFEQADVIVGPTSPFPAFPLGERSADPLSMYLCDVLTVPASLAGLPAASVPCGSVVLAGHRLPVGLQICAPWMEDARCLRVARAYESLAPGARLASGLATREASA